MFYFFMHPQTPHRSIFLFTHITLKIFNAIMSPHVLLKPFSNSKDLVTYFTFKFLVMPVFMGSEGIGMNKFIPTQFTSELKSIILYLVSFRMFS